MKKINKTTRYIILCLGLGLGLFTNVKAQTGSDDISPKISDSSGELYDNLKLMQEKYYKSLVSFKMIITKNKISKPDYLNFFLQDLIVRLESLGNSVVPGISTVRKTVVGFIQEGEKGKQDKVLRTAHDWIEKEIDDLNKSFEYVNRSKLEKKFAEEYNAIQDETERANYLNAIKIYSNAIAESVPSYAAAEIEIYEKWINQNFKRQGQMSQGVLLSIIKLDDTGGSKVKLTVRTPYGEAIAARLNTLLQDEKKRPFDLKVYKLILLSPPGCGSCADSALLTQYNQILKKPSYRPALELFNDMNHNLRDDLLLRSFGG